MMREAIDGISAPDGRGRIVTAIGWMLVFALFHGAFRFLSRRGLLETARRVEMRLRRDIFSHVVRLPLSFFGRTPTGDVTSRLTNDVSAVWLFLGPGFLTLVGTVISYVLALAFMVRISVALTLVSLAIAPLVVFVSRGYGRAFHRLHRKVQETLSAMNATLQENITGIRLVKAYGLEEAEEARFAGNCRDYYAHNVSVSRTSAAFHGAIGLLAGAGVALVLWLGSRLVIRGTLSLGGFVAFNAYLAMLSFPTMALGWVINLFERGASAMGRIDEFLRLPLEARASEAQRPSGGVPQRWSSGDKGRDPAEVEPGGAGRGGTAGEARERGGATADQVTVQRATADQDYSSVAPGVRESQGVDQPSGSGAPSSAAPERRKSQGVPFPSGSGARSLDTPVVRESREGPHAARSGAILAVRNLAFSYDGEGERRGEVLRGVSFDIARGEVVALVGPTGCGKSTLLSLILGFYPAPPGTIFLGGRDIGLIPLDALRRSVAWVGQDPFLFSDTVLENIGYGLPRADPVAARRAAGQAHLLSEIEEMPEGFLTVIGERGISLSGGQKQRATLARALCAGGELLLLDDALSAVDPETEREIFDAVLTAARVTADQASSPVAPGVRESQGAVQPSGSGVTADQVSSPVAPGVRESQGAGRPSGSGVTADQVSSPVVPGRRESQGAPLRSGSGVTADQVSSPVAPGVRESQGAVQPSGNGASAREGRTILFSTHRMASLSRCDRILVMDGGRIAEQGTHDALFSRRGLYFDLYSRQMLSRDLEEAP